MNDEYDALNANGYTWNFSKFQLESGIELFDTHVVYQTFGKLNENRDNAIVVCHALTGNAAVNEWWGGVFNALNNDKHYLICSNILGSCYGTTGPASIDTQSGKQYGSEFPELPIRDPVNSQIKLVRDALGVRLVNAIHWNVKTSSLMCNPYSRSKQ